MTWTGVLLHVKSQNMAAVDAEVREKEACSQTACQLLSCAPGFKRENSPVHLCGGGSWVPGNERNNCVASAQT